MNKHTSKNTAKYDWKVLKTLQVKKNYIKSKDITHYSKTETAGKVIHNP